MVQVPDSYEPFTIGQHPYIATLAFSSPFVYAIGFEDALDPDTALTFAHRLGGAWEHTEPDYVNALRTRRTEYWFIHNDADGPLSPDDLRAAIAASDAIRYVVPLYASDEPGSTLFSLVPNHVVISSADLTFVDMAEFDEIAEEQGFFLSYFATPSWEVDAGASTRRSFLSQRLHDLRGSRTTGESRGPHCG
jgi:hypothetical protein